MQKLWIISHHVGDFASHPYLADIKLVQGFRRSVPNGLFDKWILD
jgi:hypothetical protein